MKSSTNRKKKEKSTVSPFVRGMALFLAVLMVAGALVLVLEFLLGGFSVHAYTKDPATGEPTVRVGLMYGDDVTVGFQTTTDVGFEMGVVDAGGNYSTLMPIYEKCISVTCDTNLGKTGMSYFIAKNGNTVAIGTYHLSVYSTASASDVQSRVAEFNTVLTQAGMTAYGTYAFPAYVDGTYHVYIGNYSNTAAAQTAASQLAAFGVGQYTIEAGSTQSISVVNPNTDRIVFEFDSFRGNMLATKALSSGNKTSYIVTPAGNSYAGYFRYNRHYGDKLEGVAVTNVLPLEEYIMGVLPYEISNTWPIEAQKSFAVTVRSYTLSTMNRHESSGFDLCNTTHCQVYKGRNRINDKVIEAVTSTSHQVLTYNGKIASVYYSSSAGGTTVSVADAWGGNDDRYPYLQAIATPWENYEKYNHGSWIEEVSPTELCRMLRDKGFTGVNGAIADVKINQLATNSTYVYSITFTDIYGGSETIKYCDKIRVALSELVYSANFVVGKVGETVQITDYVLASEADKYNGGQSGTGNQGGTGNTDGTGNQGGTDNTGGSQGGWWWSSNQTTDTGADTAASANTGGTGIGGMANTQPVTGGSGVYQPSGSYSTAAYDVYDIWNVSPSVPEGGIHVYTADGEQISSVSEYVSVMNADGTYPEVNLSSLTVITASGTKTYDMAGEISGEYNSGGAGEWSPTPGLNTGDKVDYTTAEIVKVTRSVTLSGTPGNFVFVGRGWGHGVGISQYGNKDMAEAGYTYEQILYTYCRGTKIMTYEQLGY